jgi:ubiquitin carboxyl-terminal hydrolase 8
METPQPLKGNVGLANLGNTCYANSTLQALRHTEELTSYFLQERHKELIEGQNKHEAKFVEAYVDIVKCIWTAAGPGFIRPHGFWKPMQESAKKSGFEQFAQRGQQDAHEFMVFVLDMLHEGLKKEIPMNIDLPESLTTKALKAWRDAFSKAYSPLVDIFFGLQLLTVTCKNCKAQTHRFETFNCLKGSIEGGEPHTIAECLKNELKEETIEGFDCARCSPVRQDALLERAYWKLPRCLAVAVKRFHGVGNKKMNPIIAPTEAIGLDECFSEVSAEKRAKYQPYAIVDHHGSYFGGHYTSQARNPIDSKWYLYDDDECNELANGPIFGRSTYLVLLRQI